MEVDVSKSPHAPRLDSEEVPASPILIVFHELMGFSELMIEGISNAKNLPRTYRSFVQWNLDFPGPSEARKTLFSVSRILQISLFGRQQRDNVTEFSWVSIQEPDFKATEFGYPGHAG